MYPRRLRFRRPRCRGRTIWLPIPRNTFNANLIQANNREIDLAGNYESAGYRNMPWRREDFIYSLSGEGLHEEMYHFCQYISPTVAENHVREHVIKNLEKIITSLWPDTEIRVFGSYKVNVYLPTSDIDLVVIGNCANSPLRILARELLNKGIVQRNDIKVIETAVVPIIKIVEKATKLKIDISFNVLTGIQSVEFINMYLLKYPTLKMIIYIIKQFLAQHNLNDTFFGGIGSYTLILMCISFFQHHIRQDVLQGMNTNPFNYGTLLMDFLELYGRDFNYINTAIQVTNGGRYIDKSELLSEGYRPSLLHIQDPLIPGNDIARGSFAVFQVKKAFSEAYLLLRECVDNVSHDTNQQSILGRIISISNEIIQYRKDLQKYFEKMPKENVSSKHSSTLPQLLSINSSCKSSTENEETKEEIKDNSVPQPIKTEAEIGTGEKPNQDETTGTMI